MKEEWKPIKRYETLYEISSFGRVKSKDRFTRNGTSGGYIRKGKILKLGSNPAGYAIIGLHKNNKQKFFPVHRLVAQAFIPNPENKPQINHIDGNKRNNNICNLEWATRSENMKHAVKTGLLIMNLKKPKQIEQLNINGNLIKTWKSCSEIVKELKVDDTHIYNCCTGKREKAYGYKWRYKKELADCESN